MKNVLYLGLGGGYDLYVASIMLRYDEDVNPIFASYSFSNFDIINKYCDVLTNDLYRVNGFDFYINYFPEGFFFEFYKNRGIKYPVYALRKAGVVPTYDSLKYIIDTHKIDSICCLDGGVDSLMCGNEEYPGTIIEDNITMAAVSKCGIDNMYSCCIGMTTEIEEKLGNNFAFDRINKLIQQDALLFSKILTKMDNLLVDYLELSEFTWGNLAVKQSHIHSRINAYLRNDFTANDPVYYSFLMSLFMIFDFKTVFKSNIFANRLNNTYTFRDAMAEYLIFKSKIQTVKCLPIKL